VFGLCSKSQLPSEVEGGELGGKRLHRRCVAHVHAEGTGSGYRSAVIGCDVVLGRVRSASAFSSRAFKNLTTTHRCSIPVCVKVCVL